MTDNENKFSHSLSVALAVCETTKWTLTYAPRERERWVERRREGETVASQSQLSAGEAADNCAVAKSFDFKLTKFFNDRAQRTAYTN